MHLVLHFRVRRYSGIQVGTDFGEAVTFPGSTLVKTIYIALLATANDTAHSNNPENLLI